LTSCLCKVLERIIINKRLVHIIEERNLFPSKQYGFRKNRFTILDVHSILENNIVEAFCHVQSTAMISLDISKAYDMCWQYNILKKLKSWKLGGKMLQFISDFMREEKQFENGVFSIFLAVFSVTQFLVSMAGVTDGIEESIQISGYADDWMIHTTQQQQRVVTIRIQKAMNRINKRAEDTGFQGVDGENQSYQVQPKKMSNNHQTQNEHMGKRRENRTG
jgi:hypothetical protein